MWAWLLASGEKEIRIHCNGVRRRIHLTKAQRKALSEIAIANGLLENNPQENRWHETLHLHGFCTVLGLVHLQEKNLYAEDLSLATLSYQERFLFDLYWKPLDALFLAVIDIVLLAVPQCITGVSSKERMPGRSFMKLRLLNNMTVETFLAEHCNCGGCIGDLLNRGVEKKE